MRFVLDASVALSWLLKDGDSRAESYASEVLKLMRQPTTELAVPVTWGLELANVLARSELKGILTEAQSSAFLELIDAAPIHFDGATEARALSDTLQLARRYRLSSYDASYLELALRLGVPLATLDGDLHRAASRAGVASLKLS